MIELIYGFLLGCVTAACGAWKDTLFEPFEWKKFFRSPIILGLWYLVMLFIFQGENILLILLASGTLERLTVELWKALIRKPPGKFQSPTKDRGWMLDRLKL